MRFWKKLVKSLSCYTDPSFDDFVSTSAHEPTSPNKENYNAQTIHLKRRHKELQYVMTHSRYRDVNSHMPAERTICGMY